MTVARAASLALLGGVAFVSLLAAGTAVARPPRDASRLAPAPQPGMCQPVDEVPPYARNGSTERGSDHEFYFTRAIYSSGRRGGRFGYGRGGGGGGGSWGTDYPKSDRQFLLVARRLINVDACEWEHPVSLADPALRRFPFIYVVEAGRDMSLTEEEVLGLRGYLNAGGMMITDDFWGTYEWAHFQEEMARVLPDKPIVEVPLEDALFHQVYDIGEILQVPNVRYARMIEAGYANPISSEQDGDVPHVRGIYDDKGRLMVVINWNTDLGDSWEWAEDPFYPLKFSTFAYEMGVNMIAYAMSR